MKKLFDFVDEAFYINLDSRTDKKIFIEEHFSKMGISNFVKRSKGYSPSELGFKLLDNGKYNGMDYTTCCFYSHLQIIKYAKEKKLENVLIFEDDALFYTEGDYNPIDQIYNGLQQIKQFPNWEVCYLGADFGESIIELDLVAPNLIKLKRGGNANPACCFAMIIRHTIYDELIDAFENKNEIMIDYYISLHIKEKYLIHKPSIFQRYGVINDIGPNHYMGCPVDIWLEKRNKKLNYLF
ncbi:MAG: hypothetical protein RIQ48_693 [Pseudomonadota bacterium]|jgi:GR25 family glycosyltransferase involved in LPS biosynthesis